VNGTFFNVFHVPKNTTKQPKSRDPSGDLTLMPKSISGGKVCSMYKIFNLYFMPRVWVYL